MRINMRIKGALDTLFPAVRVGVLSATFLQPDHWRFMTELARHLGVTPSSLQRELESLATPGLLLRRYDGRRTYFKANVKSALFPDLKGLMEKTAGVIPALQAALKRFGERVELALLYGSIARGEERSRSDVDLMMVGALRQIDLLPALRKLETRFRREINVTLYSPKSSSANWQREITFSGVC